MSRYSETLYCPACSSDQGTHVDRVEFTNAAGQALTVVAASGEERDATLSVVPTASAKESGRRHTISVFVECELCGESSRVVSFHQHKGATYTEWAYTS